jgi:hypothetical protein
MEASRIAAKSLRGVKSLNALAGGRPASSLVNDALHSAANVRASSSREKPERSSIGLLTSPTKVDQESTLGESKQHDQANNDLQMLKRELERERMQAKSKERENELLRMLLGSERAKPASTFRRAIVMTVYPEEVVNVMGVHERNDAIFVALEATLCSSKSTPIQKVTTTFTDGHWQEEMKFILDTDKMWMEGSFHLELRQKMFVSADDPIIATASISLRCCVDWLQEGGEHSIQIGMDRTSAALKDDKTRTVLCLSVKVAAERISTGQTLGFEANPGLITNQQSVEIISDAIDAPSQNEVPVGDPVSAVLPGIPDEHGSAALVTTVPCDLDLPVETINNSSTKSEPSASEIVDDTKCQNLEVNDDATVTTSGPNDPNALMTELKTTTYQETEVTESAETASKPQISVSSDDEEENDVDADNSAETIGGRRLELAPNSNRSKSMEFIDSRAARQSMVSMMYQKKANASKIVLVPIQAESSKRVQSKLLSSLDSELTAKNTELRKSNIRFEAALSIGMNETIKAMPMIETTATEIIDEPMQESAQQPTGIDANFVATIKGVSFASQRLKEIARKSREAKAALAAQPTDPTVAVANHDVDSPVVPAVQQVQVTSQTTATATVEPIEEIDQSSATGCWSEKGLGGILKSRLATVLRWLQIIFGRIHSTRGRAKIEPFREVLDVETEIEIQRMAEERRAQLQASQLAAKKLLEELAMGEEEEDTSTNVQDRDDDAIETKLVNAIALLKQSNFELPNRTIKLTPVSAVTKVMKTLNPGTSVPHQRLSAIQNFLQSKWIDCESMAQILTWIKSPPEEVRFFECLAMRIVDKQGLARIASRFIHTKGTKYVALKTVERLIVQAKKDALSREQRKVQFATAEQELGY